MAKFTCPFCIREYDIRKVLYVCPGCGNPTTPKAFEKEPIKCKHGTCGGLATWRKCPSCGGTIPKTALETPNLPFSIVGVSNSGKTNYITVMLHELGKFSDPKLRLALGHLTRDTLDHQTENYRRIYEEHTRPESTRAGENKPQIWSIKNLQKKRGNDCPTYTFTIFDGAGEDHENNLDASSTVCRYINASSAIILAIDPLVLSNIRKVVDPDVMRNSLAGDIGTQKNAQDVINSVATYIKTARGLKTTQILNIPVAVVLTKFDTVINHKSFGPQALIKEKSLNIHNGKIDESGLKQVHDEIQFWLEDIGEGAFIAAIESHFKEFHFFGVSSYGNPPKDANTLVDHIRPHRVLDPILWLFKKAKFVD
jgi:hypothetical protein